MSSYQTRFESELAKLIEEEISRLKNVLGAGQISDIGEYKRVTGQIIAYAFTRDELFNQAKEKIENA